jgi:hypothetical protein
VTRQLTLEEAIDNRDRILNEFMATVSDWDRNLIEQAVKYFGADGRPFSMNDFRHLLPDMAHGTAGLVIRAMACRKTDGIVEIDKVKSTSGPTHGKDIGLYVLARHAPRRAA